MSTQRERLSVALYGIHKPSSFLSGLTPAGEAHLASGGSLGPDGMPLTEGMKSYSCCAACRHPSSGPPHDEWPCATVKLLLEAGVVLTVEQLGIDTESEGPRFTRLPPEVTVNIRPDRKPELHRFQDGRW